MRFLKKKIEENRKIQESRDCIKKTHDIVIRTEANVRNLFLSHNKLEERVHKHITEELKDCPKSDTIEAIDKYNKEQNGHIKEIQLQGEETQKKLDEVLNIAKGKKTVIKFAIAIMGGTLTALGTIYGAIELIQYLKS